MTDGEVGSYEFPAEIVDDQTPDDKSVRFRYIIDDATEFALAKDWWNDLGRPEVIYVEVKPDPDGL